MERAGVATAAVVARLREIGVVPIVELRAAVDGIRAIRVAFPEILLGAGTILSVDQLELALEAGADFAVTPGLNPRIVEASLAHGLPIVPGISTPSELEAARELGLRTLKLFPAELLGGAPYIRALCGPYRDVEFVPSGSITPALVPGYLAIPQVVACGGSWMVRPDTIAAGNFTQIRALAAEAVALARASR
jgi:2-dehydro-3-deoxyphosphogluconate aldolase/(4S)-4-hydroxy-2-oxoglutarate aldolase